MSIVEAMGRLWPVVAVLALLSGCTGSELRPASAGPGHAPDRVAGRTFCTLGDPITAAGRLFYPARYPSEAIPDADRCFATAAAARAAGLRASSPPPGSRLVAGIYLMPTGARLLRTCRRAAHKLGFAVACPGWAPRPRTARRRSLKWKLCARSCSRRSSPSALLRGHGEGGPLLDRAHVGGIDDAAPDPAVDLL